VQTAGEAAELRAILQRLWQIVYGAPIGPLDDDLEKCRAFFDPVARGHKLRERLTALAPVPEETRPSAARLREPLVIEAGDGRLLVGVEARLLFELLDRYSDPLGAVVVPAEAIHAADQRALAIYRSWARYRLGQVLALRDGRGGEVLQATSVGIVLALLVNRSTAADRAIGRLADEQVRQRVDEAIHSAAAAFADRISTGRRRSRTEQRLIGGYWLTEARRRLADRLVVTESPRGETSLIYIPEQYRDEVIDFVAHDLARRANLQEAALAAGFDDLVDTLRTASNQLAGQRMTFERPADTVRLKDRLLDRFTAARRQ
jgi:hypothetical protein